ncbi:hypothetical protein HYV86_01485 [Candidatus Woesearchaeota archaeon]|nr:hypothetical protein [Candidatus Woesearchaeota archaeon]
MTHIHIQDQSGNISDLLRDDGELGPDGASNDCTLLVVNHVKAGVLLYNVFNENHGLAVYLEFDPNQNPQRMEIERGALRYTHNQPMASLEPEFHIKGAHRLSETIAHPRIAYARKKGIPPISHARASDFGVHDGCSDVTNLNLGDGVINVTILRELERNTLYFMLVGQFSNEMIESGPLVPSQNIPLPSNLIGATAGMGYMSRTRAAYHLEGLKLQYFS